MAKQEEIKKTGNVEVEDTSTASQTENVAEENIAEENVTEENIAEDKQESKDVIAEEIFDKNIGCKVLYKTSDGTYFLEDMDAKNHAVTLKDKEVLTIKREEDVTES